MIAGRSILIASARREWAARLRDRLAQAGFSASVTSVSVGLEQALESATSDLVILDATVGAGEDPWAVLGGMGGMRCVAVVQDAAGTRRAFEMGAEDCVSVDAPPEEIAARCEAVLRRTAAGPGDGARQGTASDEDGAVYVDRRLWVNLASRQVWVRGEPAHLTPREFRLLSFMLERRDETMSHDAILEGVWGREPETDRPSEVLKQYIWRLRQKIEADPERPEIIVTEAGAGYRFVSAG